MGVLDPSPSLRHLVASEAQRMKETASGHGPGAQRSRSRRSATRLFGLACLARLRLPVHGLARPCPLRPPSSSCNCTTTYRECGGLCNPVIDILPETHGGNSVLGVWRFRHWRDLRGTSPLPCKQGSCPLVRARSVVSNSEHALDVLGIEVSAWRDAYLVQRLVQASSITPAVLVCCSKPPRMSPHEHEAIRRAYVHSLIVFRGPSWCMLR